MAKLPRPVRPQPVHPPDAVQAFFANSGYLDVMCMRPLSHITLTWELIWDAQVGRYQHEDDSFAEDLNEVIALIARAPRPMRYHDHEDVLAERVLREMNWPIQRRGGRWVGADYPFILEQGAFKDLGQQGLISAATGRVHAALDFGQTHFDDMEDGHLNMLAQLIAIILYHRYSSGASFYRDGDIGESP